MGARFARRICHRSTGVRLSLRKKTSGKDCYSSQNGSRPDHDLLREEIASSPFGGGFSIGDRTGDGGEGNVGSNSGFHEYPVVESRAPAAGAGDGTAGTTVDGTVEEDVDPGVVNALGSGMSSAGYRQRSGRVDGCVGDIDSVVEAGAASTVTGDIETAATFNGAVVDVDALIEVASSAGRAGAGTSHGDRAGASGAHGAEVNVDSAVERGFSSSSPVQGDVAIDSCHRGSGSDLDPVIQAGDGSAGSALAAGAINSEGATAPSAERGRTLDDHALVVDGRAISGPGHGNIARGGGNSGSVDNLDTSIE